jgi:hypothetical protein
VTSIELHPQSPDAAARLEKAVRCYELGEITIHRVYEIAFETFGSDCALTSLVMKMQDVHFGKGDDQDIEANRARYMGPVTPGYDLALEYALKTKLRLKSTT